ncbi:trans-aconitate 2-methyltransferase [Virgisporangium aliadipatigenens]|uniref:Trans-aconitate 2-methyltransferase n=1 Tax=Virgisporangium aliadipatigenens TaxID=741659 RepID=A0A8J3YUY8_9ACTN|nr:methyltransferase domain-containing protein [Virgisporangium aliadipatigenens]GIJ50198.1 trans-aconitate 2-methyltransferase [Virgisporangium aliadipatigenens]
MTSPSWDPAQYQRYADERARPYRDLTARIRTPHPKSVVDLGCGPGTMTATLAERWPDARILGIDASRDMIAAAERHAVPGRVSFQVGDARRWSPETVDVIIANAVLQWVPEHDSLFPGWVAALPPEGALAFQVPRAKGFPVGEIFRRIAASPRWHDRLGTIAREAPRGAASPVRDVTEYVDVLSRLGMEVDAWDTTYVHVLEGADPVMDWFSGTGLRPYTDALRNDPAALADFRAEIAAELRGAFPPAPYGTLLPFPRIFVVAHRI